MEDNQTADPKVDNSAVSQEGGASTGAAVLDGKVEDKSNASEKTVDWVGSLEPGQQELAKVKGWKTPADALKSYAEIEKLVGHEKIAMPKKDKNGNYDPTDMERVMTQLGRPKDPAEYKTSSNFKLPEGLPLEEHVTAEFKARAHKAGLLPHQYAFVMDEYANMLNAGLQAQGLQTKKSADEAVVNLRSKFGVAYDEKVSTANKVLSTYADPKQVDAIVKKYGNDPIIVELLANVGGQLGEEKLSSSGMSGSLLTPEVAEAKIREVKSDANHPYHNAQHPDHKFWVGKMGEWYRMVG